MPNITGTIAVAYIADHLHEVRKAVHSAHRARKRGRPYGPVELTDGVVKVTLTYDHGGDEPSESIASVK